MTKRIAVLVLATSALVVSLALPSTASASVEFGDNCTADYFELPIPYPVFTASNAADPLPTFAPSAGVITKWKVSIAPTPGSGLLRMIVVHPLTSGTPGTAQVVAEAAATAFGGQNSFDARIAVSAGDRVALGSGTGEEIIACKSEASPGVLGVVIAPPGAAGVVPFGESSSVPFRIPLVAVLEPDADHDGYGDETQDKCPQVATIQGPCPAVVLDAFSIKGKSAVTVLVAVNEPAPVSVAGAVKLGDGKTAKLKAKPRSLTPGPIAKFKLKFPGELKERLKELDPDRSLKLKITAEATNSSGSVSSDRLKLKLKGER